MREPVDRQHHHGLRDEVLRKRQRTGFGTEDRRVPEGPERQRIGRRRGQVPGDPRHHPADKERVAEIAGHPRGQRRRQGPGDEQRQQRKEDDGCGNCARIQSTERNPQKTQRTQNASTEDTEHRRPEDRVWRGSIGGRGLRIEFSGPATVFGEANHVPHARSLAMLLVAIVVARPGGQVNVRDTRLLHQPATSGTHVAFVYADDLWVARIDGSDVRRLTTDDGIESSPAFSPDGKLDRVHGAVRRQPATSTSCRSRAACRSG